MKRTRTKILSVFLSFCMIISCMVGMSVTAYAAGGGTEVTQANVICQQYSYMDADYYSGGTLNDTTPVEITNITLADAQAFGAAVTCPTTYWVVVYATDGDNLKWTSNGKTGEQTSTPRSASGRELSAWFQLINNDVFRFGGDYDPYRAVTFYFSKGLATVAVTGVTLNKTETTLTVGDTETLTATVLPETATDKTVTWASSDKTIAAVENGVVTAVAIGTATITATATNGTETTDDDKTATCTVTVVPKAADLQELITSTSALSGKLMSAGMYDEASGLLAALNPAMNVLSKHQENPDDTGDDITEAYNDVVAIAAAKQAALEAFDAPRISLYSSESIGVYGKIGQQYTIAVKGSEPDWSSAQTAEQYGVILFENLTPATWYTIYTRVTAAGETAQVLSTDQLTLIESVGVSAETMIGAEVKISVEPEDAEGLTYQWFRITRTPTDTGYSATKEPIKGATEDTYTLTEDDLDTFYTFEIYKGEEVVCEYSETGPVTYGTVKFDSNGGSEVPSITGLKYNDKVTKPADPTKDGYTFKEWQYEGETYDFATAVTTPEITLVAAWEVAPQAEAEVETVDTHQPVYAPVSSATPAPAAETPADQTPAAETPADQTPAAETPADTAGAIENVTDENENLGGAELSGDTEELAEAVLDSDDRAAIAEGEIVDVYLEVKEAEPTAEEQALIEEAAADFDDGVVVGVYLDANLFKTVKGATTQLHELNGKVEVTVAVPEDLINEDPTVERTYYVARIHDGEVEILDADFDPETGLITFYTDKFSLYAILFVDEAVAETVAEPEPTEDISIDEEPTDKPAAAVDAAAAEEETNPHTGAPLAGLSVLAMSAFAAAITAKKRKNK